MASLLYLGAGVVMLIVILLQNQKVREREARITKRDLPFTAAMVALDIAAPIMLMIGLSLSNPATASLLGNFEIVATTVIALVVFKEAVGKRMWQAVCLITASSMILSFEDFWNLKISLGAALVLLACFCWGMENNCTRMLSLKNPLQIVVIKGIGSGGGALLIAYFTGNISINILYIGLSLLLGFIAYGLGIYFYIFAQRSLGAARTSAYYAFAPFIGMGLSFAIFREPPTVSFVIAFIIMAAGAYLAAFEKHAHEHRHAQTEHEHRHDHNDEHHNHKHEPLESGEHSHLHTHAPLQHTHTHTPDLHHGHTH